MEGGVGDEKVRWVVKEYWFREGLYGYGFGYFPIVWAEVLNSNFVVSALERS